MSGGGEKKINRKCIMIAALKRQLVNKVPGSNRNSLCDFCEAAVSPQTVLWHFCTQLTELFYSSRVAQLRLHLLALTTGINVSQLFFFFFAPSFASYEAYISSKSPVMSQGMEQKKNSSNPRSPKLHPPLLLSPPPHLFSCLWVQVGVQ